MHFLRNLHAAQGDELELEHEPEAEEEDDVVYLLDMLFPCNIHADNYTKRI